MLLRQVALTWAILIFFGGLSLWEHRNNVRALHGVTVQARVVKPRANQDCLIGYKYRWGTQVYRDQFLDCHLIKTHPLGSTLPVHVDPQRPGHSIAPGQSLWPPYAIAPLILIPIMLFVTAGL